MGFLINGLKLNAVSGSMHQFLPVVRSIFPPVPDDRVVEAATAYLYVQVAHEIFGGRFSRRLRERLRERYKFSDSAEIELRICRIEAQREAFARAQHAVESDLTSDTEFARHVRCVIRALLSESGHAFDDNDLVRQIFPRFEEAIRRIKSHLDGIKRQSQFIMKRA